MSDRKQECKFRNVCNAFVASSSLEKRVCCFWFRFRVYLEIRIYVSLYIHIKCSINNII